MSDPTRPNRARQRQARELATEAGVPYAAALAALIPAPEADAFPRLNAAAQWSALLDPSCHPIAMTSAMRRLTAGTAQTFADRLYLDAIHWGDHPGQWQGTTAPTEHGNHPLYPQAWGTTHLALLPERTWTLGQAWRLNMARAAQDLATDLLTGHQPVPRSAAEQVVLHHIFQRALVDAANLRLPDHVYDYAGLQQPVRSSPTRDRWEGTFRSFLDPITMSTLLTDPWPGTPDPQDWFTTDSRTVARNPRHTHPHWVTAHLHDTAHPHTGTLGPTTGATPAIRDARARARAAGAAGHYLPMPDERGATYASYWPVPDDPDTAVTEGRAILDEVHRAHVHWHGPAGAHDRPCNDVADVIRIRPAGTVQDPRPQLAVQWASSHANVPLTDLIGLSPAHPWTPLSNPR